ncbi:MAG TPA: prepilin peptidase [Oscillatoriaceae cyanobacterium]
MPSLETAFTVVVIALFGLLIGSFLNVVIHRLPLGESIVWPGSHCPKCQHPLSALENLPVLSWLCLGARCRSCKESISWRYPANELATAGLFVGIYAAFGLGFQSGFLAVLACLLVVTFWIDLDHMVILDAVTLPGVAIGLLYSWLITGHFLSALAAALYGVAALLFINSATLLAIGRDGLGDGDMTLIAMLGAWLGLEQGLLALGLGMIAGAVLGLALLFGRWAAARHWQPFAWALGVGLPVYALCSALFSSLGGTGGWLIFTGALLPAAMRAMLVGLAALLGAVAGWLYMRTARDEGYLEMPFGPALVLGGLASLFWGVPLLEWYAGRLF